ncbi:hypothetical protein [Limnobacter sp.]|uniref:hypothetical protein n=1 Tax=Limnobacter sp. TaxID=2003368 RepID=UPI00260FF178|nr:hypothetical protein [Limnobacter sp.]
MPRQRDPCRPSLLKTSRQAHSHTLGDTLFVAWLMMLHPTHELEPPANPARVNRLAPVTHDSRTLRVKRAIAGGRRALRHVMFQLALVAAIPNPSLRAFADRLSKTGEPHEVSIADVAKKPVSIANARCEIQQKKDHFDRMTETATGKYT